MADPRVFAPLNCDLADTGSDGDSASTSESDSVDVTPCPSTGTGGSEDSTGGEIAPPPPPSGTSSSDDGSTGATPCPPTTGDETTNDDSNPNFRSSYNKESNDAYGNDNDTNMTGTDDTSDADTPAVILASADGANDESNDFLNSAACSISPSSLMFFALLGLLQTVV